LRSYGYPTTATANAAWLPVVKETVTEKVPLLSFFRWWQGTESVYQDGTSVVFTSSSSLPSASGRSSLRFLRASSTAYDELKSSTPLRRQSLRSPESRK
jgi:hypothetical protein